MHETKRESGGNGGLNRPENPSWAPEPNGQFSLGSAEEKCREGAAHIAALARASRQSNGYSLGTVAGLIGKEVPYVSKCLDVEDPHAVLAMVAAVLLLDADGSFLRGVAAARGYEVQARPALTDAEFRRRVEEHARQSKSGAAWLGEALGEDAP